jgi:NADH:ubiquinone oxidoreductase subunit 6 (subunit J)
LWFSDTFYTYYIYLFILASIILLTSMLGAIILALSTTEESLLEKKK